MTTRTAALLATALACGSCDNGAKPGGGGAAAPLRVSLKGTAFEVDAVAVDKDRRHAEERFGRVEGSRGHLLAWPRERFMKLETERADASFDVAFLDRAGRIVDIQLFPAGGPEGLMPAAEAAYALFVAPGTIARLGARAGDAVELSAEVRALRPQELPAVKVGDALAYVELALTEPERQHGLMFRPRLSADDGMLFAYNGDAIRRFWMGNTLIPLDIAFIRSDGTLVNVNETPTYPDPRHPPANYATSDSTDSAQFVLEMNLGWFRRKGLVDATGKPRPGVKAVLPPQALGSE